MDSIHFQLDSNDSFLLWDIFYNFAKEIVIIKPTNKLMKKKHCFKLKKYFLFVLKTNDKMKDD